jgi:hypothetical protein
MSSGLRISAAHMRPTSASRRRVTGIRAKNLRSPAGSSQALCRTRTVDPFLITEEFTPGGTATSMSQAHTRWVCRNVTGGDLLRRRSQGQELSDSRHRSPDARATGREMAARIASSVPTKMSSRRARVTAV